MANAKGKVTVGAEVPVGLRDELDARAAAEGRSRAEVITRAFRFYLKYAAVVPATDEPPPPEVPAPAVESLKDEPAPKKPAAKGRKGK